MFVSLKFLLQFLILLADVEPLVVVVLNQGAQVTQTQTVSWKTKFLIIIFGISWNDKIRYINMFNKKIILNNGWLGRYYKKYSVSNKRV